LATAYAKGPPPLRVTDRLASARRLRLMIDNCLLRFDRRAELLASKAPPVIRRAHHATTCALPFVIAPSTRLNQCFENCARKFRGIFIGSVQQFFTGQTLA